MTEEVSRENRPSGKMAAPRAPERAQLLSETLGHLLSARDPDAMVRQLLARVAAHLEADAYFNFMVNEKGDALYLHSCAGMPEDVARAIQKLHFGELLTGADEPSPVVASYSTDDGGR